MNQSPCAFSYQQTHIDALEITLSPGRLHLYRKHAFENDTEALKLYCWNTTLSQALYWPLHMFEVALRNAMADRIFENYGADWFDKVETFRLGQSANDEVEHIVKAKRKLSQEGLSFGHDNMVAAISMGFWESLLRIEYEEKLWKPLSLAQ